MMFSILEKIQNAFMIKKKKLSKVEIEGNSTDKSSYLKKHTANIFSGENKAFSVKSATSQG